MRLFFFMSQLILLVGLAIWLSQEPGTAHLEWGDYSIDTSAAFLVLLVVLSSYTLYLLFRLWHLIRNGPALWRMRRQLKKHQDYQDILLAGFSAIAGGDGGQAGMLAVKARKTGGNTSLTQFLQAQAAYLSGDHHAANEIFRIMTEEEESSVLGYRGLILLARRNQNWGEVRRLIEKMSDNNADLPWLNRLRFEVATRDRNWALAAQTLEICSDCGRGNVAARDRDKQNAAALLLAQSADKARAGEQDEALQLCEQASKQARNWLPAIIMLAEQQVRGGHRRAARRTVERYWQDNQHPQLAAVYAATADNALTAYRELDKLCANSEDDTTAALLLAEAAVNAELWGEARRYLEELIAEGKATQSVYRLLATIERRDKGDDRTALLWLSRSIEAMPDPHWSCTHCHGLHTAWQATCTHCGSFNTLSWQTNPSAGAHLQISQTGMWTEE